MILMSNLIKAKSQPKKKKNWKVSLRISIDLEIHQNSRTSFVQVGENLHLLQLESN